MDQLTSFQLDTIRKMCDNKVSVIAALDPNEMDSDADRQAYLGHQVGCEGLVAIGFMDNLTDSFKTQIEKSVADNKRSYKVFGLTKIAVSMFLNPDGKVN
jgi:hypothetical protein